MTLWYLCGIFVSEQVNNHLNIYTMPYLILITISILFFKFLKDAGATKKPEIVTPWELAINTPFELTK